MATKTVVETVISCDVCGSPISSHPHSDQFRPTVVTRIVTDVYYGGNKKYVDICTDCSHHIVQLLKERARVNENH